MNHFKKSFIPFLFVLTPLSAFAFSSESPQVNNAQIVTVLKTANSGEIELASHAKMHASSTKVKNFAKMMIKDHTQSNQDLNKFNDKLDVFNDENNVSADLQDVEKTELIRLRSLKGKKYDQEYMQSQIKMHQMVLSSIDNTLLPQVTNEELKTLLGKTREAVATHLNRAKEIADALH